MGVIQLMAIITLSILCSTGLAYTLASAWITRQEIRKAGREGPGFSARPGISVLKPLKGVDDQIAHNLESFFNLNYPEYELLFGVNDPKDPVIPLVQSIMQKYPGIKAKLIVNTRQIGLNPKINNLNNIFAQAGYEYILISDSNVRAPHNYLLDMVNHMLKPNVGLVVSIFYGRGAQTIGAALENLHLNTLILGSVYAIRKLFHIPMTIGKSMLFQKHFIQRYDAFYGLRDFLAEDHLLGMQVQDAGLEVEYASLQIENYNENLSIRKFLNRHLRWAKMRKHMNMLHYMMEPLVNPVFLGWIGLIILRTWEASALFSAVIVLKVLFDALIDRQVNSDLKWYHFGLIPIKDMMIGIIWLIPFFHNRVNWRGNEFKITRSTRLVSAT